MLNSQSNSQFYEKFPTKTIFEFAIVCIVIYFFDIFYRLLYVILHCANILALIFRPSFSEKFNANVKIAEDR